MISIPQRVLGEALFFSTKKDPSKVAIIFDGKEYSYSDTKESSLKLARHLVNSGIKKGDRVAIYMNNSWQCAISIYGITLAGCVFLIINPQTKASKLQYILDDSGARIIISEILLKNTLFRALENNRIIQEVILSEGDKQPAENSLFRLVSLEKILMGNIIETNLPVVIPTDLAALIYTSGSTGFPKGVMMTHQSMVFTTWSLIEYLRLSDDERIILVLPLAFDYGLYQLLMAVSTGGILIIEHSFAFPASIYKQMHILKPTVFPGVPTLFAMMIVSHKKTGLSFESVEKITNTAANLPAAFIPILKQIFPNALIFKMYGLTECKRVSYLEPELLEEKPGSVGKAIPGTELFLLDQDGNIPPPGEPGILYVRGPHIMAGYWNKEDLTGEVLKQGKIPGERILCSGDLFKTDNEGFLYFLGRTDDIIKTRGEKVSPVEIENIIYKIKGIREVAVIGMPDIIMGESIYAYVTVHDGSKLSDIDIIKTCMNNSELFMIPQKIIFLNEMPKSSNGKIDKQKVRELANSTLSGRKDSLEINEL